MCRTRPSCNRPSTTWARLSTRSSGSARLDHSSCTCTTSAVPSASCPPWPAYMKDRQPRRLIVWGRNDPLILPAAAEFVKRIVPAADLRYFDAGHFALDENADAIAEAIIETFSRSV